MMRIARTEMVLPFILAGLSCLSVGCGTTPVTGAPEAGGPPPVVTPDSAPPPVTGCTRDEECPGAKCEGGTCSAPLASNGKKDADESDVDCGGAIAPKCGVGKACGTADDCQNNSCIGGVCKPPSPTDGIRNNDETDVDCGGLAAPKCGAGQLCANRNDCRSGVCRANVCREPSPTDGVKNGDETGVDCGGSKAPRCPPGNGCVVAQDCTSLVCTAKVCSAIYPNDGVKNGLETDVDCGGPAAPVCGAGLRCAVGTDCESRFCTALVCEPRMVGRLDGDETDVDCGGTIAPKCQALKNCVADRDCASDVCNSAKKCLEGPSCRNLLGGESCGPGEVGTPGAAHESCCRTLPVPGYTDPRQPGKQVFLDKYEITVGRMRAFIAFVTAARGVPDIKGWMAAHRPSRWVNGWEKVLASGVTESPETFTVTDPTTDLLYPGQDKYLLSRTQSTWSVTSGTYTINPGIYYALGAGHFFPEYYTSPTAGWPAPDYAVTHGYNCGTGARGYGYGTYYFDPVIIQQYSGGVGRFFTQAQTDVKALNCAPFSLFAALCAWDGGQLATEEVYDFVTANNSRLLVSGQVPSCANGIISGSDGAVRCDGLAGNAFVYYYPPDGGNTYDGAARISPPGRVALDVLRINAADEPWHDMKGNLVEAVLKPDNTFNFRGYGLGYGTILHHRNQISTPRMKSGTFGARCMRFQ